MGLNTMKLIRMSIVGGITALALSTGAQAAFITYGASGTNTSFLAARSDVLDLGALFDSFTVESTLGLSLTSATAATLTAVAEQLQVVQGCTKAAASCTATDWFDITGQGLSLGTSSITQSTTPTETLSFSTAPGGITVTGVPVESLRLSFASDISPPASVGLTGSLSVTAVPEPMSWTLMMSGLLLTGFMVRRRLK
jgi:hypothetical protein